MPYVCLSFQTTKGDFFLNVTLMLVHLMAVNRDQYQAFKKR